MPKIISMQAIKEQLAVLAPDELILDVRTPEEFEEGHVPGARNIPHEDVEQYVNELKQYKKILLHCRSGKRAQVATAALEKAGLTNIHCVAQGGWLDWS
jgi:rhodanese-related sulfurtransferase